MRALLLRGKAKRPAIVALVLVAIVYFGLARLSLLLAFEGTNASPVWPPSGFALAILLALRGRGWAGIATGAFVANAVTFITNGVPFGITVFLASLVIALGNTCEAVIGRWVLERFARPNRSPFARALIFAATSGAASAVAAAVGMGTVVRGGFAPPNLASSIFLTWWVGDWVGILLVTPLLLGFLRLDREIIRVGKVLPALVACIAAVSLWLVARSSASLGSNELNRALLLLQAGIGSACLVSLGIEASRGIQASRLETFVLEESEQGLSLAPALAGLFVLAACLALWRSVLRDHELTLFEATHAANEGVTAAIESALRSDARAVERLAARWIRRGTLEEGEWRDSARAFIADFHGFEAFAWLTGETNSTWTEALPHAARIELSSSEVEVARRTPGRAVAFFRAAEDGGEPTLLLAVGVRGDSSGLIAGAVRLREVFSEATAHLSSDFDVRVSGPGGLVVGELSAAGPGRAMSERAKVPGSTAALRVEVRASARKARQLRSALPEVILGGGSVLSAMVAALLFLAQEVKSRERKARNDGNHLLKVNRELAEERKRAEAAARAKAEFLANMSHELRTPMSAVVGLSALLRDTELSPTQREYVDDLELSSNLLRQLIDDILDLSKLDAGKVQIEETSFAPRRHLEKLVQLVTRSAKEKGLELKVSVEPSVPAWFVGDPLRIAQILLNLLSNAVKFTERGGVTIRAWSESDPEGERAELCYAISDTGSGIDEETMSRLFAPFAQADASTTRRFGGTGLGLYISRSLAQLMGGKLECSSEPGRGATFTFKLKGTRGLPNSMSSRTLPLSELARPETQSRRWRILLAEDNVVNQRIAVRLLEKLGYDVSVAQDGAAAVAAVRAAEFDLVLMDWHMPGMDGLQATAIIRQERGDALPIVALTANAMEGDRDRCLAAGMNDYLTKPLSIDALSATLRRFLPNGTDQGVSAKQ